MMGIAQSVVAGQIAVRLPAVVYEGTDKGHQQAKSIEGLFTPIRVNTSIQARQVVASTCNQ
jgi:hypothetical protein